MFTPMVAELSLHAHCSLRHVTVIGLPLGSCCDAPVGAALPQCPFLAAHHSGVRPLQSSMLGSISSRSKSRRGWRMAGAGVQVRPNSISSDEILELSNAL